MMTYCPVGYDYAPYMQAKMNSWKKRRARARLLAARKREENAALAAFIRRAAMSGQITMQEYR